MYDEGEAFLLTVLMASYNGAATLPTVLDAYCSLRPPKEGWLLRFIDDGSTDQTPDIVLSYRGRLPIVYTLQARAGKCAALNRAIESALAEDASQLFVFTDDDAVPDPGWLMALQACAAMQAPYALFGGRISPAWMTEPPSWIERLVPLGLTYGATTSAEGPVYPGLVWGANMAVRRRVFEAGHRFHPGLGPQAGQYTMGGETEFTRRVHAAGFRSWFCASALVGHLIRPHQLTERWILQRASRFGRNACDQDNWAGPRLLGAPRWMWRKWLDELLALARSYVAGDSDAVFRHRWELAYLRGYLQRVRQPNTRKKVLISSCSGALGGMELRMCQEALILQEAGYRSALALPAFEGRESLSRNQASVAVHHFDPPQFMEKWAWRRTRRLLAIALCVPALRKHRADLVHVAMCWTSYGASVLWLARFCGIPSVISVHNAFPRAQFAPWHSRLYAQAFRGVRGVYGVSPSALEHFMDVFGQYIHPRTQLAVIPNGVDTRRFVPSTVLRHSLRERLGISQNALVVGCVARLAPQKRPLEVIHMFEILAGRFAGIHLVMAGDGPLLDPARSLVFSLGLEKQVHFIGYVEFPESVFPALDLHVLLSRNEGFGISTIEAMSCAVPVLGTDVPGTRDVLNGSRGGVLVALDDPGAAASAAMALLQDHDRRLQMGRFGRSEAVERFDERLLAKRVRDFYAGLAL